MRAPTCILMFAMLAAMPALAQSPFTDLRGTWKGDSESIVSGSGNTHHPKSSQDSRLTSVAFTLTIDKQDGRRFSGKFSSARSTEPILGVIARNGTLYIVDTDGYTFGTVLAPNKLELCYLQIKSDARIASCTELTKQP